MNFRTSHLIALLASSLVIFSSTSGVLSAAEPLKITGPDGQSRQTLSQYGPTTPSDTFWSIAQKTRPDNSVTIYQVMAAIYDANPHAFSRDNYNSLEKGMILLIPSKEVMAAIPKSLAKKQAELSDKGWKQASNTVAKTSPKPPAAQVDVPAMKATVESQKQIEELTAKLEAQQNRNLALTDELARAQDKLNLGLSDVDMFQSKIDELNQRIEELEQALLEQKEQNTALTQRAEQLGQQLATAKQPIVQQSTDFWRSLLDNPLYLALLVAVPGLLILFLFWLFIRGRNNQPEATIAPETTPEVTAPSAPDDLAVAADRNDESMAVHLDTDDEADSLEPIVPVMDTELDTANLDDDMLPAQLEPELSETYEAIKSAEEEEGQSLDDLWAEAMGEQDEYETPSDPEDNDLDSLLAELDNTNSDESLSESLDVSDDTEEASAQLEPLTATDNELDDLLADFEPTPETATETESQTEDLDALLTDFDLPETASEPELKDDSQDVEIQDVDTQYSETQDDNDDIAAQIAAELASEEDDVDDEDLDALLASFDSATASVEQVEQEQEAEPEQESEPKQELDDLDSLLAANEVEVESEVVEEQLAEEDSEQTLGAQETAADKAPLEFESFAIDDKHDTDPVEVKLEGSSEDVALDALLADLESVEPKESDKKESGFFDDLKGSKRSQESGLDWESLGITPEGSDPVVVDDADEAAIDLSDDSELSVDEALAALDKTANTKPRASVAEHDLTAFQQDNGFIDIDKLLNEADEEQTDVDQYKEIDVDMGELNDLMSNTSMVDVDDEENAVNAKLDLARAYIEIDDIDSATALLKEVEMDGNDRQQEEALGLLKKL
ncbi:FimV/HubP family polar landmark protein [Shewanella sp. Isolate11]|uniref:FimV/HubP family polar landmark protein n=1 Tax=Shewanella sp. Isolate11 TaxID=2908530 RepID=UPI001EFCC200|nr:FimV/HubP family polar landmark protein [Shewanella sp. Isolate11]MCG9696392.1 hypothetical protein [Shewanella sp. Isolate11]